MKSLKLFKERFTDPAFLKKQKELLEGNTYFKRIILLWAGQIVIYSQNLVKENACVRMEFF